MKEGGEGRMAKKVEVLQVIPQGEGKWLVPSGTKDGVVYEVKVEDGQLRCNCPAGWDGKMCKHKRAVWLTVENEKLGKEQEMTKESPGSNDQKGLTKSGYQFDEVTSALHKEVRLGNEEVALFWGLELYETAPNYFWKRVLIAVAEDIGMAAPEVVRQIVSLAQAWEMCKKFSWYVDPQHVVMAILLLCRAPKSTEVDDAKNLIIERRKRGLRLEVPDYAVDVHTKKGRAIGRTTADWYAFRKRYHCVTNVFLKLLRQETPEPFIVYDKMDES